MICSHSPWGSDIKWYDTCISVHVIDASAGPQIEVSTYSGILWRTYTAVYRDHHVEWVVLVRYHLNVYGSAKGCIGAVFWWFMTAQMDRDAAWPHCLVIHICWIPCRLNYLTRFKMQLDLRFLPKKSTCGCWSPKLL